MRAGWEYKKIKEVCSFIGDGDWIESKDQSDSGIRLIQTGNIGTGIYRDKADKVKYISNATFSQLSCTEIFEGDCLLSRLPDPIGRSCLLPKLNVRTITAVDCTILRFKADVLPTFFVYYTQSNSYYKDILSKTTGTTRKRISRKNLEKIGIPIPPKPTQLSIVSELDKLNELIQIKKEQLKDYDALAQSIFYEMFGDPVENEKGWEVKKLKDISRKIGDGLHGTPEYSELDTGWYFINGNNLENGCISIKSTTKKVTDFVRKKYYVEMDDFTLLVSINGTLGKSAFYNGENVILGKSACYIKLNKDVNKLFIYEIIRGEYFKRYAESVCTGTTIRNVSLKAMREFPIIYPPLPLQHSFAQKIEQIEQQKATIQKTITDLETLLAARMQYWFD